MFDNHLINPFSIGATIIYYLSIPFQRDWQRYALIGACNNGFGFGTLSLRHVGWLIMEFSAYHASFFPKPQIPLEPGISLTTIRRKGHCAAIKNRRPGIGEFSIGCLES